jgi:hypothetical protein
MVVLSTANSTIIFQLCTLLPTGWQTRFAVDKATFNQRRLVNQSHGLREVRMRVPLALAQPSSFPWPPAMFRGLLFGLPVRLFMWVAGLRV